MSDFPMPVMGELAFSLDLFPFGLLAMAASAPDEEAGEMMQGFLSTFADIAALPVRKEAV